MDYRLFGEGPDGAQTFVRFVTDPAGNKVLEVKEVTPAAIVNAITDLNHELAVDTHVGKAIRGNTQRHRVPLARIPTSLYYQLIKKLGKPHENKAKWMRWLSDPENRMFRTSEGNV